jgi:DNA polymerase-4
MKTFFHVDMDAFFVSVEELFDPSLIGKPVVVGGKANQRGVVSAASYAARKFGVHSAMPLRTAARLCPQAIFVEGHPTRYRDYSHKIFEILKTFSPQVDMASVDEAYMDLTGTERLHGPPLSAAHRLHEAIKRNTNLNCSIGIATARMVAKVASDQAKPNGVLWIVPGQEASFLAPLDVRKIPGVGKVTEKTLAAWGVRKVGDLAALEEDFLRQHLGQWGLALAGKSHGLDAGGWFDGVVGAEHTPKSISHEVTFNEDTADADALESTLARLSEMVARRLREHDLHARTVQLKLRYSDFTTITRAHSFDHGTQLDTAIFPAVRALFRANRKPGATIRLLGVQTSGLKRLEGQLNMLDEPNTERWRKAMTAVDRMRDKFGEDSVSLALGLKGRFRERVHENPAGLPGKIPGDDNPS